VPDCHSLHIIKKGKIKTRLKSIVFFLFFPICAQSYMIGDHVRLTRIAYKEFLLCGDKISNDYLGHLINANRNEDRNLLKK